MEVECVPLKDFIHGNIYAKADKSFLVDDSIAGDLERAGLVRIKMRPQYANKMVDGHENKAGKAQAAGLDQPSPSLPAAQASPPGTLHLPRRGAPQTRKPGT